MNVLITSASRKVSLVDSFSEALGGRGNVIAADITQWAAAMHVADQSVIVPRSDSGDFVKAILEICEELNVGLVIPTRDEELPILAKAIDDFTAIGTRVHVSSPQSIASCLDKRAFHQFCLEHGFAIPTVVADPGATNAPLFVRPRFGKGNTGTYAVQTPSELAQLQQQWTTIADAVVVNHLMDAPEFTIDVFLALDGVATSAVPRERMQVVAGESYVGRTVNDPELAAESIRLCQMMGLTGHNTVQAFRTPNGFEFIEVNPRFGGGAALSMAAGAPSPRWLIQETAGIPFDPAPGSFQPELVMLRYTRDVWISESELAQ